jgi:beta-fructofuranosidase
MNDVFFRPKDAWVGDLIPYYDNGIYYAFYLHDPRAEDRKYAADTTWYLATTKDCFEFRDRGTALELGNNDSPHRQCFTGSVIKGPDKKYYAFFTAFNRNIVKEGRAIQTVMMATGDTLDKLTIDENFMLRADDRLYEPYDWRDPFVYFDGNDGSYHMLLCSRLAGSDMRRGGCLASCRSTDLKNWSYEKPFFSPGLYVTMECPELFTLGEFSYLVYSTFSDRFVTHYLIRDSRGNWKMPAEDSLDARADYAIKTAGTGRDRYAFGWIATKYGSTDYGDWEWGGTMICHRILQDRKTGELTLGPTAGLLAAFPDIVYQRDDTVRLQSEGLSYWLENLPGKTYKIEALLFPDGDTREFGLTLNSDETMNRCYSLRFCNGTVCWDIWPRTDAPGSEQWQIKGDEPFRIETLRQLKRADTYKVTVVRSESIAVVYINDTTVLSYRLYSQTGNKFGFYVVNGGIEISRITVAVNGNCRK